MVRQELSTPKSLSKFRSASDQMQSSGRAQAELLPSRHVQGAQTAHETGCFECLRAGDFEGIECLDVRAARRGVTRTPGQVAKGRFSLVTTRLPSPLECPMSRMS